MRKLLHLISNYFATLLCWAVIGFFAFMIAIIVYMPLIISLGFLIYLFKLFG